ncbi:tRNA glutamyl-Q(34) synthetase GluQRS [Marinobacter caseinilyticus]|uniref:tRNA glutamyl-Q(34) synthetase GluQRS n=1 Tax=Marinobacter caseinilyticus TaxID=2692195 RepID=UPI00140DF25F|nr:tRNA glutamyl-Q(34) synthetase GluQRS [Marinobacter caseinilyticus]
MTAQTYCGRFAPSPTGPLHLGSLVTALASYLEARTHQGSWLIRIEDLDPLRESSEAVDLILHSLHAHGLEADQPVRFQSQRHGAYAEAVQSLFAHHRAYRCGCSRTYLKANDGRHSEACRTRSANLEDRPHAIRFALSDELSQWRDNLLGPQSQTVWSELDDPVLVRKEGFYAYQLAVVVDDIDQGITHVVRGSDLLEMTAQQQQIYQALEAEPPAWLHIPVILNSDGQKLSKQNHAPALDDAEAGKNLTTALTALGQAPPKGLARRSPADIMTWAVSHWRRDRIPREPQSVQGLREREPDQSQTDRPGTDVL